MTSAVRFGHFTFDYNSRLLLWNGAPRQLSSNAQDVLHALIAARPRTVSRHDLLAIDSNLDAVIDELRRALGDDARERRFIRTVDAFGFAFCDEVSDAFPVHIAATLACGGHSYPLVNGENIVGRGAGSNILIAHHAVSRRHARITVSPSEIVIEDLGSTNGTFVDGSKVVGRTAIMPASVIVFGTVGARVTLRTPSANGLSPGFLPDLIPV
jgi:DNA-binding winged helix-turn-helix (wHTH) protein